MKKQAKQELEMAQEYDFTGATRGKYAARYAEGTNAVLLEFPGSQSVNEALRALAGIVKAHTPRLPMTPKQ
jgi:hypothetical protein